MLAEINILSSERLHPATDSNTDTHNQTVDEACGLLGKNRRKDCGGYRILKGIGTPQEDIQSQVNWTLGALRV